MTPQEFEKQYPTISAINAYCESESHLKGLLKGIAGLVVPPLVGFTFLHFLVAQANAGPYFGDKAFKADWSVETVSRSPQARCAALGKRYYEKTESNAFFGMRVGTPKVVWSGCLTEAEALAAQNAVDSFNHRAMTPAPVNTYCTGQCYGAANTYGSQTFVTTTCY